jgi:peptide/nickel transport system substrate-binding protein
MKKYISISSLILLSFLGCKNDGNHKNEITIRIIAEPQKLNPVTTEDALTSQITNNIFMPLLDFDLQTLDVIPILAKSRPIITTMDTGLYKGGLTITYEILEAAKWDNGTPVTASDYIFTLKSIFNPNIGASNQRSGLDFIKDVKIDAINNKKFTVYTDKPYINAEAASGYLSIMPEYVYDSKGLMKEVSLGALLNSSINSKIQATSLVDNPGLKAFADAFQKPQFEREKNGVIGCGPYNLDSWVTGQQITLTKKANWWGQTIAKTNSNFEANPTKIIYKPIKDVAAVMSLMNDGNLDIISKLPAKVFAQVGKDEKLKSNYNTQTTQGMGFGYVGINLKNPILADKNVRLALSNLIDHDQIMKNVMKGMALPMATPFLPLRKYYDKSIVNESLNIENAKKILSQNGWTDSNKNGILDKKINGKIIDLKLQYIVASANEPGKNVGLIIQESAKAAGVDIEIVAKEGSTFIESLNKREFDLFINASTFPPTLDDPKEFFHSSSDTPDGGNRFGYRDAAADQLIDLIRITMDETKRDSLYKIFQRKIFDDKPAIFLFNQKERLVFNNRFNVVTSVKRPGYFERLFSLK